MIQVERRINPQAQKLKACNVPRQIKCANKKGAIKQQPEKRATKHPAAAVKEHKSAQETVTVSKEYLDKLLRMSMLAEGAQAASGEAGGTSHVVLAHSQVPGLEQQSTALDLRGNDHGSKAEGGRHGVRVAMQHNRSVHDQWLDDLAAQAEEQKMRREAERQQKKLPMMEKEYNPWGKPGCGAPMRTSSGNIPTDFHRKAVITGPRGIEGEHSLEQLPAPTRGGHGSSSTSPYRQPYPHSPPSHVQRHQGKGVAEDYNPWGKPGCGAPMRTSSGNVITDYRRKAVITGPNHEQGLVAASYEQDTAYSHNVQPEQSEPMVSSPPHLYTQHPYEEDPPPCDKDYNPWGRPGCGAPMATGPDTDYRRHAVITGPKSRLQKADQKSKSKWSNGAPPNGALPNKHVHPPADMQLEGTSHQPHVGTATSKPSFARGPGPHVDSYMTKDKDEARRRERERMAFIQQQIAEKERKKAEEKLRKQEEDRREEQRLYRERMDAERKREMEAKAAREREDKANKHKAMLRHMTEQARQEAESDRMEAMALKATHGISHNQADEVPRHQSTLKPPPPRQTSTLRSPSLLHAADQTSPRGAQQKPQGGRGTRPPLGPESRGFMPRRPEGSPTRAQQSRIPRLTRRVAKKEGGTTNAAKCVPFSSAKKAPPAIHLPESGPTEPVLSSTLIAKRSRGLKHPPISPPPPPPPSSPPVPALRKKLAAPPNGAVPEPPSQSHRAPPIAVVATETHTSNRLPRSTIVADDAGSGRSSVRASSPPVPALKKKLESDRQAAGEDSLPPIHVQPGGHSVVADPVLIRKGQPLSSVPAHHQLEPIVRSSSREPLCTSTVARDSNVVHLPPVVVGPAHDVPGDSIRPPTMTRQKRLLQELAILREQIITQKLNVDEKVRNTLARKLNAQ